jgi:hypothetical protein
MTTPNQDVEAEAGPSAAPATKRVIVSLSLITRKEYSEVLTVPADMTDEELHKLVDQRHDLVPIGDYFDDPEYFERGECYHSDADQGDEAKYPCDAFVSRNPEGGRFVITPNPLKPGRA